MEFICNQCPRRCLALRNDLENSGGFCQMPSLPKIARADLHFWEEPCISGSHGSGTIFFSGCSMRCVYCQNFEISHENNGRIVTIEQLAKIMHDLESRGAHNINFVNPSHYVHAIKAALEIYRPKIPLVYNSGGYDLPKTIIENIFNIYLFDMKYISAEKSLKYSSAEDYFYFASNAIASAYKVKGSCVFSDDGLLKQGVIVRHLLLPQATREAIAVCDWFSENTPDAIFSFMAQYTPYGRSCDYPEIDRRVTKREYEKVISYICEKNLKNVYCQDLESGDERYIPDFVF